MIQRVFGWEDCHLWSFKVGGRRVELPDREALGYPGGADVLDARRYTMSRCIRNASGGILYTYDFGDHWLHRMEITEVFRVENPLSLPAFIEGRWASPPEDSGGPFGFMDFKEAMADSTHEEHVHLREWYGRPFDPKDIGEARIERALASIRASRRRKTAAQTTRAR